jgi:hypothetical protein
LRGVNVSHGSLPWTLCQASRQQTLPLVSEVDLRTEQVGRLVVLLGHHRLLERDEIGPELAEGLDQHQAARVPVAAAPQRLSVRTRI